MERFLPHDWLGVLLHVGIAAAATFFVATIGFPFFALFANSVGWPVREFIQRRTDWSAQKHWEAWAPVLVGWLVVVEVMARGTHGL